MRMEMLMKKLKWILMICLMFCFGVISISLQKPELEVSAYLKQDVIEWDAERKLVYANQNSLTIEACGTGTTIKLVSETEKNGFSLMDLYNSNPSAYSIMPPADGADLSDWSVVFGSENYKGNASSSVSAKILMTGGKIKNVYAGHSVLEYNLQNYLKGSVTFELAGGEVESIFAECGYEQYDSGCKAFGTTSVFNLYGGKVESVVKDGANNATINLKGDVCINRLKIANKSSAEKINIIGNFTANAFIRFQLYEGFSRSDNILKINPDLAENFDFSKISNFTNAPQIAENWELYVSNDNFVRYGFADKVQTAEIVGEAKVGETLSVSIYPQNASADVVWYRINNFVYGQTSSTVIGAGETYTLKSEDGGRVVYAKLRDKNDASNVIQTANTDVVKRIVTSEIVTDENGQVTLYANGADLIIKSVSTGTAIYFDFGQIGVFESEHDISLFDYGVENAFANNADLSNVYVSAGSSDGKNAGDIAITMLGGKIKGILTSSTNSQKLNGSVVVNLLGGDAGSVLVSKQNVKLNCFVNISGELTATINGMQNGQGATKINVVGDLLGDNCFVKFVLDEALINESMVLYCQDAVIDTSKLLFVSTENQVFGSHIISVVEGGVKLVAVDIICASLDGKLDVGQELKANLNPVNANVTYTWLRSKTNSLNDAEVIEGENKNSYKLTEADKGFHIILVLNYGQENQIVVASDKLSEDGNNSIVVWIIVASVIFALLAIVVVWFILWKNNVVSAGIFSGLFNRISKKK